VPSTGARNAPGAAEAKPSAQAEPTAPSAKAAAARQAEAEKPESGAAVPTAAVPSEPVLAKVTVATPCGEKGQPDCPLQGWMDENLQAALDAGDLAKLARGLAHVPKLVPDSSWNAGPQGWSTIAEAGAAAAKSGDGDAAKQSCKSCHKAWRSKYKASFRPRALPQ
jgi:hypothetical protein